MCVYESEFLIKFINPIISSLNLLIAVFKKFIFALTKIDQPNLNILISRIT